MIVVIAPEAETEGDPAAVRDPDASKLPTVPDLAFYCTEMATYMFKALGSKTKLTNMTVHNAFIRHMHNFVGTSLILYFCCRPQRDM